MGYYWDAMYLAKVRYTAGR